MGEPEKVLPPRRNEKVALRPPAGDLKKTILREIARILEKKRELFLYRLRYTPPHLSQIWARSKTDELEPFINTGQFFRKGITDF